MSYSSKNPGKTYLTKFGSWNAGKEDTWYGDIPSARVSIEYYIEENDSTWTINALGKVDAFWAGLDRGEIWIKDLSVSGKIPGGYHTPLSNSHTTLYAGNTYGMVSAENLYIMGYETFTKERQPKTVDIGISVWFNSASAHAFSIDETFTFTIPKAGKSSDIWPPLDASKRPQNVVASMQEGKDYILVSWKNPVVYDSMSIERKENNGEWTTLSVNSSATSYIDNSVSIGRTYQYRLNASTSESRYSKDFSYSNQITTNPNPPSNFKMEKPDQYSFALSWKLPEGDYNGHLIEVQIDGSPWRKLTTVNRGVNSYLANIQEGKSIQFRLASFAGVEATPRLCKSYLYSPIAAASRQPDKPTLIEKAKRYIAIDGDKPSFNIKWRHFSLDYSKQEASKVEVINTKTGETVETVNTGESTEITRLINNSDKYKLGETYQVTVQTKGFNPTYSPKSDAMTFTIVAVPKIIMETNPQDGKSYRAVPINLKFSLGNNTLSYANISIVDPEGRTVYSVDHNETTLKMDTFVPVNKVKYYFVATARDGYGQTAQVRRWFMADYVEPNPPQLSLEYDLDHYRMMLAPVAGKGDGAETESLSIVRVDQNGETLITPVIQSGSSINDNFPPFNTSYKYRVTALAPSGAVSVREFNATVNAPGMFVINYGENLLQMASLSANAQFSNEPELEQEAVQYLGRKRPVLYSGNNILETITLSGDVFKEEDIKAWFKLREWSGRAVYRDNKGRREFVSCKIQINEGTGARIQHIEAALTVVE